MMQVLRLWAESRDLQATGGDSCSLAHAGNREPAAPDHGAANDEAAIEPPSAAGRTSYHTVNSFQSRGQSCEQSPQCALAAWPLRPPLPRQAAAGEPGGAAAAQPLLLGELRPHCEAEAPEAHTRQLDMLL